ncbi:MAG: hypothetical protein M0P15_04305 [Bacteroides sp.]|nr:hypothetical protein [Bacteroides sp.]
MNENENESRNENEEKAVQLAKELLKVLAEIGYVRPSEDDPCQLVSIFEHKEEIKKYVHISYNGKNIRG